MGALCAHCVAGASASEVSLDVTCCCCWALSVSVKAPTAGLALTTVSFSVAPLGGTSDAERFGTQDVCASKRRRVFVGAMPCIPSHTVALNSWMPETGTDKISNDELFPWRQFTPAPMRRVPLGMWDFSKAT